MPALRSISIAESNASFSAHAASYRRFVIQASQNCIECLLIAIISRCDLRILFFFSCWMGCTATESKKKWDYNKYFFHSKSVRVILLNVTNFPLVGQTLQWGGLLVRLHFPHGLKVRTTRRISIHLLVFCSDDMLRQRFIMPPLSLKLMESAALHDGAKQQTICILFFC